MANTKISNLTASAANLASTDLAPIVQTAGVGPVKMTGAQIAAGLLSATTPIGSGPILSRAAAATLQLGAADAAAPVAQTLQVQSVVAGTTNTAGANWTLKGSAGTGTGAGGSIIFQVAPAGSSGTAQNAYATALTLNSAQQAVIQSAGTAALPSLTWSNDTSTGFYKSNPTILGLSIGGTGSFLWSANGFFFTASAGRMVASSAGAFSFSSGTAGTNAEDVFLYRDAANTLALRNGTNAQTFNVYNTYTDASNYERAALFYIASRLTIAHQYAGTGATRSMDFLAADFNFRQTNGSTAGSTLWYITTNGLFAGTDNTYDIGASAANRPRYIRAGSAIVTPSTTVASLPAAATAGAGARSFVTDANATTFLSTVAGGGANKVPVVSDGTNWLIG